MVVDRKKATYGQLNHMDRLSDLPDSILHHIISYVGTKEACRTSILSKRWAHIWSTGLILDFRPQFFVPKIDGDCNGSSTRPYSEETVERFMNFVESTMQRYSEKNLSIRVFTLEYPTSDQGGRIDRWVRIALQNQVEELSLSVIKYNWQDPPPSYTLPPAMFSAKSLMSMKLYRVRLPYIEDASLPSLQSLDLTEVDVDKHTLQHILMSCPLKILKLHCCTGLPSISIPSCSRLESVDVALSVPKDGTILVDTTSLQHFTYHGYCGRWPKFILTPASRKNLRELHISNALIEDDIFSKLVSELPSIEGISLLDCRMSYCIRIASQTLKELRIDDCYGLSSVTMEAPELDTFLYIGDPDLLSVTNSHNKYNAYFHLNLYNLDNTRGFLRIQHLLSKSNCCKFLYITLDDELEVPEIEFDEGELSSVPPSDAINVPELKLFVSCRKHIPDESTCRALIDGLLWCCQPDILSVSLNLPSDNSVMKTFLEVLQEKVKYWKHPLKRVEMEGANCSSLLSSRDLEVQLRLYW